jgi:hypothetical protein
MVQLQRREVALSIVPMRSYRARRSNIAAAMETLGMRLIGRWMAKFQSQVGIRLTSNNRRTEIDLLTSGIRYSKMTALRTGTRQELLVTRIGLLGRNETGPCLHRHDEYGHG